jgi:hypothetical protein
MSAHATMLERAGLGPLPRDEPVRLQDGDVLVFPLDRRYSVALGPEPPTVVPAVDATLSFSAGPAMAAALDGRSDDGTDDDADARPVGSSPGDAHDTSAALVVSPESSDWEGDVLSRGGDADAADALGPAFAAFAERERPRLATQWPDARPDVVAVLLRDRWASLGPTERMVRQWRTVSVCLVGGIHLTCFGPRGTSH